MAPEVINSRYDHKCDIWSCGVLLYTMLCGTPPFIAENNLEVLHKIKIGNYSIAGPQWTKVSNQAKDLLSKMLRYNPSLRVSAFEALDHSWFRVDLSEEGPSQIKRQNNIHTLSIMKGKKNKENVYNLTKEEI